MSRIILIPLFFTLIISTFLLDTATLQAADTEILAAKPPLGWNSFDSYGVYLHEKAAAANIEAMAAKLKPFGYEFFVIDNGWFGEYKLRPNSLFPAEKHANDIRINKYGYFLPSKTYFPSGLQPLSDKAHKLGLKFGVHLMRGIPRKAVEQNLPIEGTPYHAKDIAVTDPKLNCRWCKYCYGVDMSKPGAQEWYNGLIAHIASLGVDYIKYDDIVPYPQEVEAVAKAIKKTGKPIILSLSPGNSVDPNAIEAFRKSNLLRVTHDVWDSQKDIDSCFDAWEKWQGKERPGFWIDQDMIPFGKLQLMSPPAKSGAKPNKKSSNTVALAGKGTTRQSELSHDQMETFITLRALAASPLMVGGDLPTLDDFSLKLLTDKEMLACNQNGVMGKLVSRKEGIDVWQVTQQGSPKCGWFGIFNRTEEAKKVRVLPQECKFQPPAGSLLHNVWKNKKITVGTHETIPAHGVIFVRYSPQK